MFQAGQKFGQYTLVRKLAKGGFGEVWLAEKKSPLVTRQVAVKLPHGDQINFAAIQQEATLWEKATGHPNVVPLIDADIYDDQVVIASEYIEDGSLADLLRKYGKLPVEQAARIGVGVLKGLEYLHSKSIVHRDVKPANILMHGDVPRLADFGISRATQTTMVSSTIIGTHSYMSPESFEGVRNVKSDLWSVGVLLYHLSTGNLPFPLGQPSEMMYAVLMKEPQPLPDEIPPLLRQIIYKALEKDRELGKGETPRRYQTAAEMRIDLEKFLEWLAVPQPSPASPHETVKFFPDSQAAEMATRMRVPVKNNGGFFAQIRRALAGGRLSPAVVFGLILGVGAAIALASIFMFSQQSSSSNSSADSAAGSKISAPPESNVAVEQPPLDDAAIRAAKEFQRQANELYSRKRFDRAIETYTLAVELNPSDYALYNNRGAAYHASGELQKAITDYTRAIELNPYHFSAYNNRGAAYEDVGNVEQAVADYRKALELDPDNKLAKDNLKKILK